MNMNYLFLKGREKIHFNPQTRRLCVYDRSFNLENIKQSNKVTM